jgi:hypothetical protein
MAAVQSHIYATKRDVSQLLEQYVRKDALTDFVNTSIQNSVEGIDVYSKAQIDTFLSNYLPKAESTSIIENLTSYYTKNEVTNLIDAKINFFKNNELNFKLENYVYKHGLDSHLSENYYNKLEVEAMLQGFVKADDSGSGSFNEMLAAAMEDYLNYDEVNAIINTNIKGKLSALMRTVTTMFTDYVTKDALGRELIGLRQSIKELQYNLETNYEKTEDISTRIHRILANNFYNRTETKLLVDSSIAFFRDNYLKFKLENYVLKEYFMDYLWDNYYSRDQVDELVNNPKFCKIEYLTQDQYTLYTRRNRIENNCIYIVEKFDRPVAIYIGSLQIAKRDMAGSIGFPYTFPLAF